MTKVSYALEERQYKILEANSRQHAMFVCDKAISTNKVVRSWFSTEDEVIAWLESSSSEHFLGLFINSSIVRSKPYDAYEKELTNISSCLRASLKRKNYAIAT